MEAIDGTQRGSWSAATDPAELFIRFWNLAARWTPADRATLPRPLLLTRHRLEAAAALDDGPSAIGAILAAIEADWPTGDTQHDRAVGGGLVIEAMHAIELAFATLHPRTRLCPASLAAPADPAAWVDRAERRRLRHGSYVQIDDYRLVPSGPFSRHARGRDAAAANSLQDHFPHLTVAPTSSREGDRVIAIDMKVIGTDAMRGVPAATSIGRERIRFIPLAEARDDLKFTTFERSEQPVIDIQPTIDMCARLLAALGNGLDVDIAFAPELTVPGSCERELGAGITTLANLAPRIILAGSGLSEEKGDCGRPWNEARVFGRGGHLLWRQRKIWPYGMPQGLALKFGLPDPGPACTLMEDIAGASTVLIVDLDGFGRCVVLICQDVQARPVVDEIVARYQPDWILTPVLDAGVKIPGWAHTRALELSRTAQARVLVASSITMSLHDSTATTEPTVGLAVGPTDPTNGLDGDLAPSRAVALVEAITGPSPRSGLLVWDHIPPVWKQSTIGVV